METAIPKYKRLKPNRKQPVERMTEFLQQQELFTSIEGHKVVIRHLWAGNFRINLYKMQRSGNSVMEDNIIVNSWFVRVRMVNGNLAYEVIT